MATRGEALTACSEARVALQRDGFAVVRGVFGRAEIERLGAHVDGCRMDNGPLRLVPGSHLRGPLPHGDDRTQAHSQVGPGTPRPALLEPGDVAIFGPFVIHGSTPNRSADPRRVLVSGFALPGANHRRYPGHGAGRCVSLRDVDPAATSCCAVRSRP